MRINTDIINNLTFSTIGKISIFVFTFFACSKPEPKAEFSTMAIVNEREKNGEPIDYLSSVTLIKGKYFIDTNIINKNGNKKVLLEKLESETLIEKKKKEEIPAFITAFLDSISKKRKFDIANENEEWQIGIANMGKQVITKVWDETKKDSVLHLSYDGSKLPTKQLAYFGASDDIALLSYYCGGIYTTQHAVIIQYKNGTVTDFWFGLLPDFATNKKALINTITSTGTKSGVGKNNGKC